MVGARVLSTYVLHFTLFIQQLYFMSICSFQASITGKNSRQYQVKHGLPELLPENQREAAGES